MAKVETEFSAPESNALLWESRVVLDAALGLSEAPTTASWRKAELVLAQEYRGLSSLIVNQQSCAGVNAVRTTARG